MVENLKILHITDLHYDNLYKVGSDAKCNRPVCCQIDSGDPEVSENAAGFWGDYNVCDQPWHAVLDLFEHVIEQHVSSLITELLILVFLSFLLFFL